MIYFALDASALAKRYVAEPGSAVIDYLLTALPTDRLYCLTLGALETFSIVVRARNSGRITDGTFIEAIQRLRREVFLGDARLLSAPDSLILRSDLLVQTHNINANDAIFLRALLDIRPTLQGSDDDLVLLASDLRLLRAARLEGLPTFNPEAADLATHWALAGLSQDGQ